MKLLKWEILEKHLKEAHPEHLSNLYLIACLREGERRYLMQQVAECIQTKLNGCLLKRAEKLQEGFSFLEPPPLFHDRFVVTAPLSKKEEEALFVSYARAPARNVHFVLGIENGKWAHEIYQLAMRELVLLDLSTETLKERRQRLVHWAARYVAKEGKKCAGVLLETLVQRSDFELALIEQELNKLLCYVGDREEIQKDDLNAICTQNASQISGFQLAEQLIDGKNCLSYRIEELSQLLLLIGQMRYFFESGLKVAVRLEKGECPQDKNLELFRRRKTCFFKKSLLTLFQLELKAKQNLATPQILLDRFCVQIMLI